jgi:PAS domain S-box-containing protein
MRAQYAGSREPINVEDKMMEHKFPFRIEANVMRIFEAAATCSSLDDFFEAVLSHLLHITHVRQAEIFLFNKQNELVLVAYGKNSGPKGFEKQQVMAQSWMINSAVRHSIRRVKLPDLFFVASIPLKTKEKQIGLLKIQTDQIQRLDNECLNNFYLIGLQLSAKIKEIFLQEKIKELSGELQGLTLDNKENQQRLTSLSKELYAICAISTKINQSMDIKKSLRKSIVKIKEVFKASGVLVYLKTPGRSNLELSSIHKNDKRYSPKLLREIETFVMRDFYTRQLSMVGRIGPVPYCPQEVQLNHRSFKSAILAPMRIKKKLTGELVLLYESSKTLNQENLRLLCGIADIVGMAIENMNLYRQSQQEKKTAAFLVQSISKFSEKLDLEKTLKSIAEKGAEFIGKQCRIFLFSETVIPMIHLRSKKYRKDKSVKPEMHDAVNPEPLKDFYEQVKLKKRPSLVSDIGNSHKFKSYIRSYFKQEKIQSLISVPLRLAGKPMGLLLFCSKGGKKSFDHIDLSVCEALGAAASVAIENSRSYSASVEMSDFLEKKISQKTAQIQKIQERHNIRVENRNDIIFRVNTIGRFVFVNKAMEMLTGLSREEIYRENFGIEDVVVTEDRKRVRNCFQIVLKSELPMIKQLEYRHVNRRGKDHIVSLTIYPEKDINGAIIGVEGVGRDISDKRRLENELEKTKDLALLGEFSSAIAHQIRNPLGNILMGTKLLQRAVGLEDHSALRPHSGNNRSVLVMRNRENLIDIFKNLSEGIYNLNQVVTELVEYTKTLKLSRSFQQIDVILEENLSIFHNMITQKGIILEKSFQPDLPAISVDAVLIGQVFQNIIHNAIQAMDSGGRLTVSTTADWLKPGYAVISVCDMGIGIAPEQVEKIFHPFYTSKDSGTGLGLSLAHRIVDTHQGEIWVCQNPCPHFLDNNLPHLRNISQPKKGVTLHILLPMRESLDVTVENRVGVAK